VPYTRVEWLEVDGNNYIVWAGMRNEPAGSNALFRYLLVHDVETTGAQGDGFAFAIDGDNTTIRNCIAYEYGEDGIYNTALNLFVQNTTLHKSTNTSNVGEALQVASGSSATVENVIATDSEFYSEGTLTCYNSISSNDSATSGTGCGTGGSGNRTWRSAASLFVSATSGYYDLHLKAGSDARDTGMDLLATRGFSDDVDGQSRPSGAGWDVGADEAVLAPLQQLQVLSGSYDGDGSDNREITVGFQPDLVIVDSETVGPNAVIRSSTMQTDPSKVMDQAGGMVANQVQSLTPTGFTVGTLAAVNQAGVKYHWVAMKSSAGLMKIGTYPGTGTASQTVTGLGFTPVYVVVIPEDNQYVIQRSATMLPGYSMNFAAESWNTGITAFRADGFDAGTLINTSSVVYHYIAWAAVPGSVTVGTYVGNNTDSRDITGAGFLPEWVSLTEAYANGATGGLNAPAHKPASTGITTDKALLFNANVVQANNIQALQADGFQVGNDGRVNSGTSPNTYHWAAFGPHASRTYYRSIGNTGAIVGAGASGISVTNGSNVVDAPGAQWVTGKRGRGDVITIAGVNYMVGSVVSETRLYLSEPYPGATQSGLPTQIRRQFATLADWKSCIDGQGATPPPAGPCYYFPAPTTSLVADDRNEVGIVYNDGSAYAAGLVIDGSTTDATHTIALTVDPGHRHNGIGWSGSGIPAGVAVDNNGNATPAIEVRDDYVTVEWLDVRGGFGASADLLYVGSLTQDANSIVIRQNLLHNGSARGIQIADPDTVATVSNNIVANVAGHGIHLNPGGAWTSGSRLRFLNNTVVPSGGVGPQYGIYTTQASSFNVLLANNLVFGAFTQSFSFADGADSGTAPDVDPASRNNLSADGTAATHSPAGGSVNSAPLFVNAGGGDYHLSGSSQGVDDGADLRSLMTAFDIDGEGRVSTWDIGADEYSGFTAVTLSVFRATGLDSSVSVEWETATELSNLGFHLYRGLSESGPWQRLNASLIRGLGSSPEGKRYSYLDSGLRNGATYFYRLEDLDRSGRVTSHGPVSATPLAGAGSPGEGEGGEGPGEGESPSPAWTPHGDPTDVSLRVLSRTARSVTFELRTGGFYSLSQDDGSHRLFVPGFFDLALPGFPALPTRRTWTDAVAGLGARVVSVTAEDLLSFDGLVPPRAGAPQAVAMNDGTYQKAFRPVAPRALGRGLYPRDQARVLETAFQGDTKKAYVEFVPLRLDAVRGRLVLARSLVVTLLFDGVVPGETGLGGSSGRSEALRRKPPSDGRLLARFASRSKGLHAVTWEELLAATTPPGGGLPDLASSALMLDTASMRLSRLGVPVPFHVEPRSDRFVPGSTLFFLAQDPDSAYTGETVYELAVASDGIRMAQGASSRGRSGQSTEPLTSLVASPRFEQDREYLPGLLDAPDLWQWAGLLGGTGLDFPFTLASLAPGPARLRLDLQGASDTPDPQDHHLRVSLGGVEVAQAHWDGMAPFSLTADVPQGLLVEGANTLRLDSDGLSSSAVYLDRFSLDLPHALAAEAGLLEGRASAGGLAEASGFPRGSVLLDLTGRLPQWLGRSHGPDRLVFPAEAGHRYLAVSPTALLHPQVRPVEVSSLRDAQNQADWILVAPQAFLPAAEPLLLHREAQGLSAIAVSLEEITAEFGYGETSPDALRDFLAFAYHHWTSPSPRYVLLLGDASYDPRGFLSGTSRKDVLPTPFTKSSFLWTASDPTYASTNGQDLLPDLALGRITAGSLAEAQAAVQKILDFENAGRSLSGKAVLVADNPDLAGDFEANANDIASLLPSREVQKIFLTQYGPSAKAQVLAAFDAGPALVSYVGHGSQALWANASENLFRAPDVALLQPQPQQPLVLTMTCSNGYFVSPWANAISERLTLAPDKGSIAAFSPSGLSLDAAAHLYHRALAMELEQGSHQRLGDLVLAAQAAYLQTGAFPELLAIYHLFGDPAGRIR
jgi:hypothetical protein